MTRPLIIWLLITCLYLHIQAQFQYGDTNAAGHYLKTRGINLYYETYGQGDPVLMLHINGGSIKVFSYQIPYFSKNYRVISVDSQGHGKSEDGKDSQTFEMMADYFNALLDNLHLDSCYVSGWCDGGISSLLLPLRHPEKVKKLVVSGPNLKPDTTGLNLCYHANGLFWYCATRALQFFIFILLFEEVKPIRVSE